MYSFFQEKLRDIFSDTGYMEVEMGDRESLNLAADSL